MDNKSDENNIIQNDTDFQINEIIRYVMPDLQENSVIKPETSNPVDLKKFFDETNSNDIFVTKYAMPELPENNGKTNR